MVDFCSWELGPLSHVIRRRMRVGVSFIYSLAGRWVTTQQSKRSNLGTVHSSHLNS
jgi:hypothetical protein